MKSERLELKDFQFGKETPILRDEQVIGQIILRNSPGDHEDICLMDVFIEEDYRNQGYGFESMVTLIDHAFIELDKHKIMIEHDGNESAEALLKKLGFVQEAHLVAHKKLEDGWGDLYRVSMINPNEGDNEYLIDPKLIEAYLEEQERRSLEENPTV